MGILEVLLPYLATILLKFCSVYLIATGLNRIYKDFVLFMHY